MTKNEDERKMGTLTSFQVLGMVFYDWVLEEECHWCKILARSFGFFEVPLLY